MGYNKCTCLITAKHVYTNINRLETFLALTCLLLMKFASCRGVSDIGTGLQAVAAAITDPDTISAFQSEHHDDDMSHRTFYGGMHELAGGVDHAADGIQRLSQVLAIHETLSFSAALSA